MEFKGSLIAPADGSAWRSVSATYRPTARIDVPEKDDTGRDCTLLQRYIYGYMSEAERTAAGYKSPADVNVWEK